MKIQSLCTWEPSGDEDYTDAEDMLDESGFIPPDIQIRNMIEAGQVLDAIRDEMYNYDEDDDDLDTVEPNPFKIGNDPAENEQIARQMSDEISQSYQAANLPNEAETTTKKADGQAAKPEETETLT